MMVAVYYWYLIVISVNSYSQGRYREFWTFYNYTYCATFWPRLFALLWSLPFV